MSSRETHYCCSAAVTVLSGRYITLGLKDQKREKKKERERGEKVQGLKKRDMYKYRLMRLL